MNNELLDQHKKISLTIRVISHVFRSLNKIGEIDVDILRSEFKGRVNVSDVDVIRHLMDYSIDLIMDSELSGSDLIRVLNECAPFKMKDAIGIIENDVLISHQVAKIHWKIYPRVMEMLTECDNPLSDKIIIDYDVQREKQKLKITVE